MNDQLRDETLLKCKDLTEKGAVPTQRMLAASLSTSLGKVNALLKSLINENWLDHRYFLSPKALDHIESFKVKNAVILAAGYGSRLLPLTKNKPKGMVKVKGEAMVERIIKQLREVGVKEIALVTGYMHEKYRVLQDGYGVKILYTEDFSRMNNFSSLYCARNELGNSYVIPQDVYLTENVFRSHVARSGSFCPYMEEENKELRAIIDGKKRIKKIACGGEKSYAVTGFSYIASNDAPILKKALEAAYVDPKCANDEWENVLDRILDEIAYYLYPIQRELLYEFDSLAELRLYDESYKDYKIV